MTSIIPATSLGYPLHNNVSILTQRIGNGIFRLPLGLSRLIEIIIVTPTNPASGHRFNSHRHLLFVRQEQYRRNMNFRTDHIHPDGIRSGTFSQSSFHNVHRPGSSRRFHHILPSCISNIRPKPFISIFIVRRYLIIFCSRSVYFDSHAITDRGSIFGNIDFSYRSIDQRYYSSIRNRSPFADIFFGRVGDLAIILPGIRHLIGPHHQIFFFRQNFTFPDFHPGIFQYPAFCIHIQTQMDIRTPTNLREFRRHATFHIQCRHHESIVIPSNESCRPLHIHLSRIESRAAILYYFSNHLSILL